MVSAWSRRLDAFFIKKRQNALMLMALAFAVSIGVADYFFGPDLLLFTLLPIFFAAWYGGRRIGNVISIYCAGSWYVTDTLAKEAIGWNPEAIWTFLARLAMFLVLTRIISKLRESKEQQKELTNFIVHDLRSPISSSITGLLTLKQNAEHLDDEDREMVDLALVSNQRALSLVSSLLDVSKLESGKMDIRWERVGLAGLVDDAVKQVTLWAKGNDVRIVREVEDQAAWLDPELTQRILVNLLSNALKFSPAGTQVTVRVRPVGKEGVQFEVEDHGPGIPAEYAERIFEPFSQVAGTKGGTGLGLTFCRLAVQAQGGRIGVNSQPGKGTTMHFALPHGHAKSMPPSDPDRLGPA